MLSLEDCRWLEFKPKIAMSPSLSICLARISLLAIREETLRSSTYNELPTHIHEFFPAKKFILGFKSKSYPSMLAKHHLSTLKSAQF